MKKFIKKEMTFNCDECWIDFTSDERKYQKRERYTYKVFWKTYESYEKAYWEDKCPNCGERCRIYERAYYIPSRRIYNCKDC